MDLGRLKDQYSYELGQRITPFWLEYSLDVVFGGYFNVLSTKGELVSTDKWVVWQGQQCYTFLLLFGYDSSKQDYLHYAQSGADFLLKIAENTKNDWPSVVDRTGRVVRWASDCEAEACCVLAWAAMYGATNEQKYATVAKQTLLKLLKKRDKRISASNVEIRQHKNLGELTAIAKALLEARLIVGEKIFIDKATALTNELQNHFWEPRADILLENVVLSGGYCESIEGRAINVGKIFEAAIVFIELATILKKKKMVQQLAKQVIYIANTTWDEKYGGYFSMLDIKNLPDIDGQYQNKPLWVQLVALVALQKVSLIADQPDIQKLWQRTHDYAWLYYPDRSKEGEWKHLLNRQGEPIIDLKASPTYSAYQSARLFVALLKQM
jgi:N-acylglucosamine 2-epimerase